jgi:hypothetical protein
MNVYSAIGIILALNATTVVAANHHPNLRTYQNTTSSAQAFGKGGSSSSCKDPEVYCGMTIHAGKTLTLEKDLVCTKDTPGKDNANVAITLKEGATLDCGGRSIVQLNDEVGKATTFTGCLSPNPVTDSSCGLSWGAIGVLLKSGASVKNCIVSGWQRGFAIAPGVNGDADEIKMETCEATLNFVGLSVEPADDYGYVVNYSVKKRYVLMHMYIMIRLVSLIFSCTICITQTANTATGTRYFIQSFSSQPSWCIPR